MLLLVSGIGLGCLIQLFINVLRDFRHLLVGRVFLLALLVSGAYVIHPILPPPLRWLTSILQTAMPGVFWLVCQLVFSHRPRLNSVWGALALYSFLAPAVSTVLLMQTALSEVTIFLMRELALYCEYLVILHGLYFVISHWQDDLVKSRRMARLIFLLVFGGAVGGAAISLNLNLYHELVPGITTSLASSIILACLVTARAGILSMVDEQTVDTRAFLVSDATPEAKSTGAEAGDEDAKAMRALNSLMQGGYYTTEKLTLKKLSVELGIPEYRLRTMINQKLGFRNFNDYINQLRVAEAARRLSVEADVPVLNVSLDVGFRSLSSFNRAFRDILQCTPTEFRHRHFKS